MFAWLQDQYIINEKGCWVWIHSTDTGGYGRVGWHEKLMLVHRLYWLLSGRTIPAGLGMCHGIGCSKACYNPEHLRPDTRSANRLDQHADGTMPAKLTADQVRAIRLDKRTQQAIGDAYKVSRETIKDIKSGRSWTWLV